MRKVIYISIILILISVILITFINKKEPVITKIDSPFSQTNKILNEKLNEREFIIIHCSVKSGTVFDRENLQELANMTEVLKTLNATASVISLTNASIVTGSNDTLSVTSMNITEIPEFISRLNKFGFYENILYDKKFKSTFIIVKPIPDKTAELTKSIEKKIAGFTKHRLKYTILGTTALTLSLSNQIILIFIIIVGLTLFFVVFVSKDFRLFASLLFFMMIYIGLTIFTGFRFNIIHILSGIFMWIILFSSIISGSLYFISAKRAGLMIFLVAITAFFIGLFFMENVVLAAESYILIMSSAIFITSRYITNYEKGEPGTIPPPAINPLRNALTSLLLVPIFLILSFSMNNEFSHTRLFRMLSAEKKMLASINDNLTGSGSFEIIIKSDGKTPVAAPAPLKQIDEMQSELQNLPDTRKIVSIVEFIKIINRELHNSDQSFYEIPCDYKKYNLPDERSLTALIAQFLLLYDGLLNNYAGSDILSPDTLRVTVMGNFDSQKERDKVTEIINKRLGNNGFSYSIGGFSAMENEICAAMSDSLLLSVLLTIAIIIILAISGTHFYNAPMIVILNSAMLAGVFIGIIESPVELSMMLIMNTAIMNSAIKKDGVPDMRSSIFIILALSVLTFSSVRFLAAIAFISSLSTAAYFIYHKITFNRASCKNTFSL